MPVAMVLPAGVPPTLVRPLSPKLQRQHDAQLSKHSRTTFALLTDLNDVIKSSNKLALQLLGEGRREESLALLQRARNLLKPQQNETSPVLVNLRVLTFNNLACWHRQNDDSETALQFLKRAARCFRAEGTEVLTANTVNDAASDDAAAELTQQLAVTHR
jgi:hypothetical protein